jgi:hypothetical protein
MKKNQDRYSENRARLEANRHFESEWTILIIKGFAAGYIDRMTGLTFLTNRGAKKLFYYYYKTFRKNGNYSLPRMGDPLQHLEDRKDLFDLTSIRDSRRFVYYVDRNLPGDILSSRFNLILQEYASNRMFTKDDFRVAWVNLFRELCEIKEVELSVPDEKQDIDYLSPRTFVALLRWGAGFSIRRCDLVMSSDGRHLILKQAGYIHPHPCSDRLHDRHIPPTKKELVIGLLSLSISTQGQVKDDTIN